MTICIYCKNNSSGSRAIEHVIPANLGIKEVLPVGFVCDDCNNYFSDMDKMIMTNKYIAINIGTEEIKGRNDKIRQAIGPFKFSTNRRIQIQLTQTFISENNREIIFEFKQSKEFDELLFARAIHKCAFNIFAFNYGLAESLLDKFNRIRKYVRSAVKNEFWNYGVKVSGYDAKIGAEISYSNDNIYIKLHILCADFHLFLLGWKQEYFANNRNIQVIRGKGFWNESTFYGLKTDT